MNTCQWLGPEYDPRLWPERNPGSATPFCGHATEPGRSYCAEHYHRVYAKNTALRKNKKSQKETVPDILELLESVIEEVETELDS